MEKCFGPNLTWQRKDIFKDTINFFFLYSLVNHMPLKKTYCLSSWVVWSISWYSNALGHFLFDRTNCSLLKISFWEWQNKETQNSLVKIIHIIFLPHIAQVEFWTPAIPTGSTSWKLLELSGMFYLQLKKSLPWRLKQEKM